MPKPSDDLSDEQLHHGVATGEYEGRDALVAEEILRRRHEERARTGPYRLGFIGAWAASFWLWIKVRLKPRGLWQPAQGLLLRTHSFLHQRSNTETLPWVARFYFGYLECQFPSLFF